MSEFQSKLYRDVDWYTHHNLIAREIHGEKSQGKATCIATVTALFLFTGVY